MANALLLIAALVVGLGMVAGATRRVLKPDSWWEGESLLSREDPLRRHVRQRLAGGGRPPTRAETIVWSVAQTSLGVAVLVGGVVAAS
jgi:hypothetical protein